VVDSGFGDGCGGGCGGGGGGGGGGCGGDNGGDCCMAKVSLIFVRAVVIAASMVVQLVR